MFGPDLFVDVFSITIFISVLKLSCRIPGLDLNSYFEAFHDLSPRFAVRLQNVQFSGIVTSLQ